MRWIIIILFLVSCIPASSQGRDTIVTKWFVDSLRFELFAARSANYEQGWRQRKVTPHTRRDTLVAGQGICEIQFRDEDSVLFCQESKWFCPTIRKYLLDSILYFNEKGLLVYKQHWEGGCEDSSNLAAGYKSFSKLVKEERRVYGKEGELKAIIRHQVFGYKRPETSREDISYENGLMTSRIARIEQFAFWD